MTGGYIEKRLKKINGRRIAAGVIVLVITLIILFFSLPYFVGFFGGPTLITGAELVNDTVDGYIDNAYVTVEFDDIYDSGIYETATDDEGNEYISFRYYVGTLDDYEIIIQSESEINGMSYTGELFGIYDWAAEEFFDKITELEPNSNKTFIPIILYGADYLKRGFYGLALALLFLFLSILLIATGTRHNHRMEKQPSMKELAQTGPLEFIVGRINAEMESIHEKIGRAHFLANHLLFETRSGFSATRYDDIVWAYKVSVPSRNFGILFGTRDALMVYDRFGREMYVPLKSNDLDRGMSLLLPRIPYAFKGYTNELASVWHEDPKIIFRGVDERKSSVTAPTEMPPLPQQKASEGTQVSEE